MPFQTRKTTVQVYLPKERVVVTSQHIKNIETLTVEQNEQVARRLIQYEPIVGENEVRVEKKKATSNSTHERPVTRSSNKRITASPPTNLDRDGAIEVVNIAHELEPKNYNEAIRSTQKDAWELALQEELNALEENGVWIVGRLPKNANSLHSKWM